MLTEGRHNHNFNTRIKNLLNANAKSVESLAQHLRYDVSTVEQQLSGQETFAFQDLLKICAFFNLLPTDFLYDRVPEKSFNAFGSTCLQDNGAQRMMYTREQIVMHYFSRVVFN